MEFDVDYLKSLVLNPRESFDVELKQWINPANDAGIAKIVRACMAMRNNNGGCIVIGLCNDGTPDSSNVPSDVRAAFHFDVVQHLVSRFASHPFEIAVEFVEREGIEYPIICVPSGVDTPVASRRELIRQDDKKTLVPADTVFVRTLQANNTVSTAAAKWQDYERLTKICLENREADIGAFVRRHLSNVDLGTLNAVIKGSAPEPSPIERAVSFLEKGVAYLENARKAQKLSIPVFGVRQAAIVLDKPCEPCEPDQDFLNRLMIEQPRLSGWSPWVDLRNAQDETLHPYVMDGGWETLIVNLEPRDWFGTHVDFWRIEAEGRFFHHRAIEDDMERAGVAHPKRGTEIDFLLQISRVTEILACAQSFAKALKCDPDKTSLACAFRWAGLKGRHLTSWVEPGRHFYSRGASMQDAIITKLLMPVSAPQSSLAGYVERIVGPLFGLFGGMKFQPVVIEGIVSKTLSRQF